MNAGRTLSTMLVACSFVACRSATESGPQAAQVIAVPESITMPQKGSVSLAVSVRDNDDQQITGAAVTFTSSDVSIVTVTNLGVVNSVGPAGTTSVVAKSGKASTTIPVTVQPVASGIVITPDPVSLPQKATLQLNAKVLDAVGVEVSGAPITFASGDPAILDVSSSGLLTSLGAAGNVSVTLSSGSVVRAVPVVITQVATDLLASPSSAVIAPHGQVQLTATVVDAIGTPMPVTGLTWASSDESIVTVSGSALVSPVGRLGSASITVKSGNLTRIVPIDVVSVAHPTGTLISSIPLEGTSAIGISSTGVILAPSFQDERTYRVDSESQTTTMISGARGVDIAFSSDGTRAYVANPYSRRIDMIDVASNAVVGSFGTSYAAGVVRVSRDNQTLYAGSAGSPGILDVYDLATQTVKKRLLVSDLFINALTLHPSRDMLYVSWTEFHYLGVSEIDMNTNGVTRQLRSFRGTGQPVVSLDGKTLYVPTGHTLDCYDLTASPTSFAPQGSIIGPSGTHATLTPDGRQIWVVGGAAVFVVDLAARAYHSIALPTGSSYQVVFTLDGSVAVITGDSSLIFVR